MDRQKIFASVGGIALAAVIAVSVSGNGSGGYPGGGGGSPTPIWPTATIDPTIQIIETEEPIYQDTQTAVAATETAQASPTVEETVTPFPTVILPNTGAGSTAPQVHQNNHTGWHYYEWCDSGWILWYRYYAYSSNHNKHYNESFGNWGRCWF